LHQPESHRQKGNIRIGHDNAQLAAKQREYPRFLAPSMFPYVGNHRCGLCAGAIAGLNLV